MSSCEQNLYLPFSTPTAQEKCPFHIVISHLSCSKTRPFMIKVSRCVHPTSDRIQQLTNELHIQLKTENYFLTVGVPIYNDLLFYVSSNSPKTQIKTSPGMVNS